MSANYPLRVHRRRVHGVKVFPAKSSHSKGVRLSILDRYMLSTTWPAIAACFVGEIVGWVVGGPTFAATAAALALGVGLSITYAQLSGTGELSTLAAVGVSPRRAVAAVVAVVSLAALAEAVFGCVLVRPNVRTEYAGYVLSALQPVFVASSSLPVVMSARGSQPWARMFLVLMAYVACLVVVHVATRVGGVAPGLPWFYVISGLSVADAVLYRYLNRALGGYSAD